MILLNGTPINVTIFPDKTSQVWKLPEESLKRETVIIDWKFESEAEFLHLAQLKSLLDSHQIFTILNIPYLPYARQDKDVSNASTFALHSFANLLNSLRFDHIMITDPHSKKALDLIERSEDVYPRIKVIKAIEKTNSDAVCYPDGGALSKYKDLYYLGIPVLYGDKVRDQQTGNITRYELIGDPSGKNVMIVDDLCDGGATFKILAKDLFAKGAKSVVLFVTHGIFSKGTNTLLESGISRIFTRDGEVTEHRS